MTTDLNAYRRFFAEDIQLCANLRSDALTEALATVPRERFPSARPVDYQGRSGFSGAAAKDAQRRSALRVPQRRRGHRSGPDAVQWRARSSCAPAIDALALESGQRALHIGGGTGYYTALMAHVVGPSGSVRMIEVDEDLARQAAVNLGSMPWVTAQHSDGRSVTGGPFSAIMINAGVTHPEPEWLSALAPGGRLVLPLTAGFGAGAASAFASRWRTSVKA
jgi:protein-L-isoaspartate(D-aspartate) O-methyltransferase